MKKLMVTLLLVLGSLNAQAARDFSVTTGSIPKTVVEAVFSADQIVEIPLLNTVEIIGPKFTFDKDFGYGTEILPLLKYKTKDDHSYITDWICNELGYGEPTAVKGTRPIVGKMVMGHFGAINNPTSRGLNLFETKETSVPNSLICLLRAAAPPTTP